MNVLDLFSGIGGFSLGLERAGMRTVAFCESEPYAQAVLRKHWPDVPVYPDVRTIPYIGNVGIVAGGFPCQPWSHAGKQRGTADDRHLWPAMLEVIKRERPTWVLGENVAGIIKLGLDPVLSDLEAAGYACRTFDIPAVALNAQHARRRIWIVAHANVGGCGREGDQDTATDLRQDETRRPQPDVEGSSGMPSPVAHSNSQRGRLRPAQREDAKDAGQSPSGQGFGGWVTEPGVGRVANGVPGRTHRLRCLGNAVVPQIPEIIGMAIMAATEKTGATQK